MSSSTHEKKSEAGRKGGAVRARGRESLGVAGRKGGEAVKEKYGPGTLVKSEGRWRREGKGHRRPGRGGQEGRRAL